MKKIILSISLILAYNISNAQSQRINSEKIDAYKKIYLTEKLNLDQKNESKFWEVYNIYQENLKDNYRKRRLKYRTINLTDPFVIAFGGITQPTCPNDSNGIATLGSSGCPCMFSGCTYLWENGITTKTNNNLPVGWSSVEITHVNGCVVIDSVLINQSMYDNSTGTSIVSTCNSFSWDSIVYSSSGTYFNTYTNSFGCDSIHTLVFMYVLVYSPLSL